MEAWGPRNEDERTWRVIDTVRDVAKETGATPAAVSLAWLDAQPGVTSVILGARTVDQLNQNIAAVDLELDDELINRLSQVSAPRAEVYPYGAAAVAQRHRDLLPAS
jgi:aryl-alcohol dehydrogenase-like predicted oxidoreductase